MSTPKKKPSLNGLPGNTTISQQIRSHLNLDPRIITLTANQWDETTALVDNYFETHQLDFRSVANSVYDTILATFLKISTHEETEGNKSVISKFLRDYCASVHSFLRQKDIYIIFVRYYNLKEFEARKELLKSYKEKEEEVAEEAIERKLVVRIGKRAQRVSTRTHTQIYDIIIIVLH